MLPNLDFQQDQQQRKRACYELKQKWRYLKLK